MGIGGGILLFGEFVQSELPIGGDFYWLYFFQWFGLSGLVFYFVFIILNMNKKNIFPLLVLIISTLHYHTIFSIPGQLIFGYILSRRSVKDKVIKIENSQ